MGEHVIFPYTRVFFIVFYEYLIGQLFHCHGEVLLPDVLYVILSEIVFFFFCWLKGTLMRVISAYLASLCSQLEHCSLVAKALWI